jgi:hypothetical protein
MYVKHPNRNPVNRNLAGRGRVKAGQQIADCAFSRAASADDEGYVSGGEEE